MIQPSSFKLRDYFVCVCVCEKLMIMQKTKVLLGELGGGQDFNIGGDEGRKHKCSN
uniref:Uncharacterized protein n=1 Tax=Octopus bimaculoides TaxID=37653 RepID=A0A0L8GD25_OCTBM